MKFKEFLKLLVSYFYDFSHYFRWNYNNSSLNTQNALESKMLRETHVIEKGMSLANPRIGFGQEKIKNIFNYIDEYIDNNYSLDSISFQNSIFVLKEYIKFQKKLDYTNLELEKKIEIYEKYITQKMKGGIEHYTIDVIKDKAKGDFKCFFESRHSVRQFSESDIDLELVKKAIKLAQKAPSACNRQSPKVYFFNSKKTNNKLAELIPGNTGFENDTNKYLIVTSNISAYYDTFERNQMYVDGGIFLLSIVESLHYYGIASCIIQHGEFIKKDRKIRESVAVIPNNEKIIAYIAIGNYKNEFNVAISQRKSLEDVLKIY